jgi:hypothetical protein
VYLRIAGNQFTVRGFACRQGWSAGATPYSRTVPNVQLPLHALCAAFMVRPAAADERECECPIECLAPPAAGQLPDNIRAPAQARRPGHEEQQVQVRPARHWYLEVWLLATSMHSYKELEVTPTSTKPVRCRGELPNIRGMFSALRYFDISSNVVGGFIPQAWADTGIIRLVRS